MVKYLNFGNISTDLFAESDNFKLFMGDTGLLITQILRTSNFVQLEQEDMSFSFTSITTHQRERKLNKNMSVLLYIQKI